MSTDSQTQSSPPTPRTWARVPIGDGDPAETTLTYDELRDLSRRCGKARVSIALPTHLAGPDARRDPLLLAALLRRAELTLADQVGNDVAQRLLRPLTWLRDNAPFWAHGRRGLVLLVDDDGLRAFKIGRPVTPIEYVGERFRTLPLLSLLAPERFYVLAVSPARVQLYEGDLRQLRQLPQGDLPRSLEDVVGHDLRDASLQFHTAGPVGQGAIFHGQGAGQDDRDHERERFLRRVVEAMTKRAEPEVPIVVAAVERTVADLRRLGSRLAVTAHAVHGNPDDLNLAQLHEAAWACAQPQLQAPARTLAERIAEQLGTPKVASGVAPVLRAARRGRVKAMLVGGDEPRWGLTDRTYEHIELHEHCRDGDTDLVDLAVAHALACGSDVHLVSPDAVPGDESVAAVLRF